jgi:pimeloyl-ACP methyl ester carboxylesterase
MWESMWSDWRLALVATTVAVIGGIVGAWLMPRGPITVTDALVWMAGSLVIGLLAGLILGSRWSLLLGPVAFVIAFELARMGVQGPTVDGVHLGSTYGIIAFVVGRGIPYLLSLAPMAVGSSYGVELAARLGRSGRATMGAIAWGLTIIGTIAIIGLAMLVARPATTSPVIGADGRPVSGSIAEITTVSLGGHDQALLIRGRSDRNPVLLHLAGGPGGTDLGAMRADTSLEDDFIVVTWDQRGTGKSYGALDPVETLTPGQMIADTIELTEHLRDRFGEERIYLHGNSWGSLLGVLAVQQRPDLYHAWIGTGQMISPAETDRMFWEDTVAWAESRGDAAMVEALRKNGPPPYEDVLRYELALSHEHDWNPYPEWDGSKEMPFNLFVPENDLMDRINGLRAFLDTFAVLYPQLQDIDLRIDVPRLEVPVYMVVGAHEARGRAVLADEWFEAVEAPHKERIVFEHSGHRPSFEEPGRFAEVMSMVVGRPARGSGLLISRENVVGSSPVSAPR